MAQLDRNVARFFGVIFSGMEGPHTFSDTTNHILTLVLPPEQVSERPAKTENKREINRDGIPIALFKGQLNMWNAEAFKRAAEQFLQTITKKNDMEHCNRVYSVPVRDGWVPTAEKRDGEPPVVEPIDDAPEKGCIRTTSSNGWHGRDYLSDYPAKYLRFSGIFSGDGPVLYAQVGVSKKDGSDYGLVWLAFTPNYGINILNGPAVIDSGDDARQLLRDRSHQLQ